MSSEKKGWLCLQCGKTTEPDDNLRACPNCGSTNQPVDLEKELNVKITWQELRIIVMWSERWASSCKEKETSESMMRTVYRIADRIQQQHLDQECGLTFASELAELRASDLVNGDEVQQNVIREIPPEKL